jgi:hypothetical protein
MKEEGNGNCFEVAAKVQLAHETMMEVGIDDDVAKAISLLYLFKPPIENLILCHGIVSRPTDRYRHCHAWCEFDLGGMTMVVDTSNGNQYIGPADAYFAIGEIDSEEVYRYTHVETRHCMIVHETWGPWEGQDVQDAA